MLKRFVLAFLAFVGLIVPASFALALLAAPAAHPAPVQLPGCDRNLADATASVASMQARIKISAAPQDRKTVPPRAFIFSRW